MDEKRLKLIQYMKIALANMDKNFTNLSRLKWNEIENSLQEKLIEQKIQERPFAYEFYYQFRKFWVNGSIEKIFGFSIFIQAEVNKRYQVIPYIDRMPDFLLHKPNSDINIAVIEFKLAKRTNKFKEDFDKLFIFKQQLHYLYLIEVIIGNEYELKRAEKYIKEMNNFDGEEILILKFDSKSKNIENFCIKYRMQ